MHRLRLRRLCPLTSGTDRLNLLIRKWLVWNIILARPTNVTRNYISLVKQNWFPVLTFSLVLGTIGFATWISMKLKGELFASLAVFGQVLNLAWHFMKNILTLKWVSPVDRDQLEPCIGTHPAVRLLEIRRYYLFIRISLEQSSEIINELWLAWEIFFAAGKVETTYLNWTHWKEIEVLTTIVFSKFEITLSRKKACKGFAIACMRNHKR